MKSWTGRRQRQACPPGPFLDVVQRTAARERAAMPPVWVNQRGHSAGSKGGPRAKIVVSAQLLDEPPEIQQWLAAHEMGHVVLGHRMVDALPRFAPWVALIVAVLVAANFFPTPPQLWMVFIIAAVLTMFNFGCALTGFAAFARQTREDEVAADRFALDQGYPVTDQVVAWITAVEPRLLLAPVYGPWRTHPMPADRRHPTNVAED